MEAELAHITCPHCEATNRVPYTKLVQQPKCGKCHQELFAGKPLELSSSNFSKVINKTSIPIVVDFWAPWCGPCNMMAPIFDQVSAIIEPQARLAKLNTEFSQDIASRYGIRSIPTLMVFKNGKEVARQAGAMDQGNLVRFIEANL
ncbi:MAG: thioredoxin TrxC [Gammaproteobacteria bacterium]|nr:thioredoxin TrxC [Gammaproteobacteria bacterium]